MNDRPRLIASYERVSSDDQRERETIKTQTGVLDRHIALSPDVQVYRRYRDDGVSGTIPLGRRPAGKALVEDAMRGAFSELWVTRPDRLGRDEIDLLQVYVLFESLGVKLVGVSEPIGDRTFFGISAVMASASRRQFLKQSKEGMDRAAREGRFPGGLVPYGYKVEGRKHTARLMVSDDLVWQTWTESDVIRQIFRWSGVEGWSCPKIADQLNSLGVPTAYQKDGRCVRKRGTKGEWTPGRERGIITNTTYKGLYQYGKRNKDRENIVVPVQAIVSEQLWDAAQKTLAKNRIRPKRAKNVYPLRSLLKCDICGLNFTGTKSHGDTWYRCNGQIAWSGKVKGRCWAKSVKGKHIEPIVLGDIERWIRKPGDLLEELAAELQANGAGAQAEAERQLTESALQETKEQRNRVLEIYRRNRITLEELEAQMDEIQAEQEALERRLAELEPEEPESADLAIAESLRAQLHERLDAGLSAEDQQEVAAILVRQIRINTERVGDKKRVIAVIEYRFPDVADGCTDRGSSRPPA